MDIALSLALFAVLASVAWFVAKVFRGGAPTGESSARADINEAAASHGTEQMDNIRSRRNN